MSTPRSLDLPKGVSAEFVTTARATMAVHRARPSSDSQGRVLLIPGWTGSKEDFTPILPLLAAAGFDTVAFDQRGQFETPGSDDDNYSLDGLAADALALATATFAEQPFHVLGHSFGGLVAQRVALFGAARPASLSLLCTGPGALSDSPSRPLTQLVTSLRNHPDMDALFEQKEAGNPAPPEILAFMRHRFVSNSPASLAAITQHLIDAPDVIDQVAATGLRTWVGRGAGDDAWPWTMQDDMAARLGTSVVVIAGANHSPAVENPAGLVHAWLPFLLN